MCKKLFVLSFVLVLVCSSVFAFAFKPSKVETPVATGTETLSKSSDKPVKAEEPSAKVFVVEPAESVMTSIDSSKAKKTEKEEIKSAVQEVFTSYETELKARDKELDRFHFGIGAGVDYTFLADQPKLGASLGATIRKGSLLFVVGAQYADVISTFADVKSFNYKNIGAKASVFYEF